MPPWISLVEREEVPVGKGREGYEKRWGKGEERQNRGRKGGKSS
jgi:hypothetical protein